MGWHKPRAAILREQVSRSQDSDLEDGFVG
jgi:hypothetical protein